MNFNSVLVKAIDRKKEVWTTRINRRLERHILKKVAKKLPFEYDIKLREYCEENYGRN